MHLKKTPQRSPSNSTILWDGGYTAKSFKKSSPSDLMTINSMASHIGKT